MVRCPCHKKPMEKKGEDYFCLHGMGYWETSELEYLYGKNWKRLCRKT